MDNWRTNHAPKAKKIKESILALVKEFQEEFEHVIRLGEPNEYLWINLV